MKKHLFKHKKLYIIVLLLILPLAIFLQHVLAKDSEKIAYITFDDGPTLNTPRIVETLEKYGAKATFFVLEERIVMYPEYIKEIKHSGNALGLHGVSHSEAIYYTDTSPLEEMEKTNNTLKNLLGSGSKLVRVPFGSCYKLTQKQAQNLSKGGYIVWDWNVDPRDSVGKIVAEKVLANLRRDLKKCDGDAVILLHDRKSTADLLPSLLQYLKDEGYRMMPLSEKQTPLNFIKADIK